MSLATRQGGSALSQLNVTKANIHDGLQLAPNLWNILEEVSGFFDSHIKHFSNILAPYMLLRGFQSYTVCHGKLRKARKHQVKVHFNLDDPVAFTVLTATTLNVETKAAFL